MNKRDETADFIIKNLAFVVIFFALAFYAFLYIVLPQIQNFKNSQANLHSTQTLYNRILSENQEVSTSVQEQRKETALHSLEKAVNEGVVLALTQGFLENVSLKEIQTKTPPQEGFKTITYQIQAIVQNPQQIFDFVKILRESFPNSTLIPPFTIQKQNLLQNVLKAEIYVRFTQNVAKEQKIP
ncbi:hypothetical protein BBW65_05115 [Helicobacter enhydrae]|uniref:General secretion pathway protein GspM n=1 Tax=Helicobacter enhydrae TaxID=222136 RepID=A0A1B1U5Z6_9HELI|nr:hypothetical protein [Helicobacter enhydrae]ANV98217.1 hypothetical protein BBW65_05115 [Helicobacter enhydrae]